MMPLDHDPRVERVKPRRRHFEGADTPEGGVSRKTALIQILALPIAVVTAALFIATVAIVTIGLG